MDSTIVSRYDWHGKEWVAYFEDTTQVAFGSDMPMKAVRRLLEGTEAERQAVLIWCDRDMAGTGRLRLSSFWDPPELLIPCQACEGRGEYVGLL